MFNFAWIIRTHKVSEHEGEEDDLRDELGDDVEWLVEVLVVPVGEDDAEEHVEDAHDDAQLHLEGVQEHDLVLCDLPDGVDADRVGLAVPTLGVGRADHVALEVFGRYHLLILKCQTL